MEEFLQRFNARGAAIREAYTGEDTRPVRPVKNPLVNVMIDLCHRAAVAGLDPRDLLHQAQEVFEFEAQFVGDAIREDAERKSAERAQRHVQAVAS